MDQNIRELFAAIDIRHSNEMTIPTAALIYVAIDTLGWMAYGASENSSKKRFIQWCQEYIGNFFDENCTEIELYSSRCATLHSISSESSLSASGQARKVFHLSGENRDDAKKFSKSLSKVSTTCIHIDTLIKELKNGAALFFENSKSCKELSENIEKARKKQFVNVPVDLFKKVLPVIENLN
ncbi:hypothetical protein QK899_01805 [Pseudomonas sp. AR5]|nr:hypothetical protein QK899_01805 [Pseudomonas sp. AR5]